MAIYDGIKRTAMGSLGEDDSILWVATTGSEGGNGSFKAPFALPSQALAKVNANRKTVICLPGEYTEATTITWPETDGVVLTGFSHRGDSVVIIGAEDTDVIDVTPSAKTSTFDFTLADLTIDGDGDCSGIVIDNTSIGAYKKMIMFLNNVNISMNEDTYEAIEQVHGQANADFRMYCHGPNEYEGLMVLEPAYAGDRYYFHGIKFPTGFQVGNGAVAARFEFRDCIIKNDSGSGDDGASQQTASFIGCASETGGTYAAVAGEDVGANITATVI
jgi:hypothetical protein